MKRGAQLARAPLGCAVAAAACLLTLSAPQAAVADGDGLDQVRVALRTLQYDRAVSLLQAPVKAGKPRA